MGLPNVFRRRFDACGGSKRSQDRAARAFGGRVLRRAYYSVVRGVTRGRLFVGTSGFAYKDWTPLFYPADWRSDALLEHYATRLNAVELNNTFYRQPRPDHVASWLAATPESFRFIVKAQRGGSIRAFGS